MFKTNWDKKLIVAAYNGDMDGVEKALEKGADINFRQEDVKVNSIGTVYHASAICAASTAGHDRIVSFLADKGADLGAIGHKNWFPLWAAARFGHRQCVYKLLLKPDVEIDRQDANGNTPLMISLKHKNADIADDLIVAGAKLSFQNDNGQTAVDLIYTLDPQDRDKLLSLCGLPPVAAKKSNLKDVHESFERLNDDILLHELISESGFEITTVFNFQIGDIIRVQTKNGVKLSEDKTHFSELDNQDCLKIMFDRLVKLGGKPSTDWRKIKTVKPVPMARGTKGGADV